MVESQEEPNVGVFICRWGKNIASIINVEDLVEHSKQLPGVTMADQNIALCSEPGANFIKECIQEKGLDSVVIGAWTPKTHQPVFHTVLEEANLPKRKLEFVNLREQVSFVHMKDQDLALEQKCAAGPRAYLPCYPTI